MKLDAEKTARIKHAGMTLAVAIVVGAGAYWYGTSSATPKMVAVSQTGCGATPTAGFGVPLETIKQGSPKIAASYGPLEIPAASFVRFEFDPQADGTSREVNLVGDTLHLPVTFGSGGTLPERIRINCRDGGIATIRYETGSRTSQTFAVVRQDLSMLDVQN